MSTTSNPRQVPLIRRDRRGWRDCGVVGALAALVVATGLGLALPARAEPIGCRAAILKAASTTATLQLQLLQRCEERIVKGKLPLDTQCSSEPRTAARIAKAEQGMRKLIARKCGGKNKICAASDSGAAADDSLASIGWNLGTCPDFDAAGCANEIQDCGGIADCVACVNRTPLGSAVALTYGELVLPTVTSNRALNKCQQAIGREATRYFTIARGALRSCWGSLNRGKKGFGSPCPVGDPSGRTFQRIKKAELRLVSRICRACGGNDKVCGGGGDFTPSVIGFPSSCPDVVVPGPDGRRCGAAIGKLEELVACVDCVTQFEVACLDRMSVPWAEVYPPECNPACGNGFRDGNEVCDTTDDAACPGRCLSTCTCPPPSSPTPSIPTPTPTPKPGESATPSPQPTTVASCGAAPRAECRAPVVAGKGLLLLADQSDDAKDLLVWKWLKGTVAAPSEFGDPTATTSYALCLYDQGADAPRLRLGLTAPAGQICDIQHGRACWRPTPRGFRYRDPALTPSGLRALELNAGADGKARIVVKGGGPNLAMPSLSGLVQPLRAQLVSSEGGCWEATYGAPALKRDATRFRDHAD